MTILEMLGQSTLLAIFGMAIVFLFLWIMIICVDLMGLLIRKMCWDNTALSAASSKHPGRTEKSDIIAAITAAVQEYRKTEKASVD
jgi:oxaloacetate decarboxylase gamma subunit